MNKIFKYLNIERNTGLTLIEAVIYIAIFAFLFVLIVNVLITMSGSFAELERFRQVTAGGATGLERMSREIRDASSINIAQSTLGSSPGAITLNTIDANDDSHTVRFSLTSGVLYISDDGGTPEPLTGDDVSVTNLIFRTSTSTNYEAVKVEMTVESQRGAESISIPFYNTIVLRGSYE